MLETRLIRRFIRRPIRRLAKAGMLAGFFLLGLTDCKSKEPGVELKGLTGAETRKQIDYVGLFGNGGKTITFTHLIGYESSYHTPLGRPAAYDEGTQAAYKLMGWLGQEETIRTLFDNTYKIEANDFPANPEQIQLGKLYHYKATAKRAVQTPGPAGKVVDVNLVVNVVLGASAIEPSYFQEQDSGPIALLQAFHTELANAFVNDDVVTYNGHIWEERGTVVGRNQQTGAIAVEGNTRALAAKIEASPTGRTKPGLVYVNACFGEEIETFIIDAMQKAKGFVEPILLSHRGNKHSNFDYFAFHDATIMIDLLGGKSLPKLMLDLTATYERVMFQGFAPPTAGAAKDDSEETARAKLAEYLSKPQAQYDEDSIVIVAYDIKARGFSQRGF